MIEIVGQTINRKGIMAAIDSDIIENLDKAGELVKRFVDALLDWKTENDARRARLDAMGDELLKYMAEIKNAARKCLPMNKSLSKSVQSNEPSAKPQSATLLPIPVVQHSPTVQLEIMHPTTSTSNQQKDSEPLKPTSKRKLHLSSDFLEIPLKYRITFLGIPIKKEIGTTKPKPTKNVTPLPRLLLSPVTIKKEARKFFSSIGY